MIVVVLLFPRPSTNMLLLWGGLPLGSLSLLEKILPPLADPLLLATPPSMALDDPTPLETFPDLAADLEPVCEDSGDGEAQETFKVTRITKNHKKHVGKQVKSEIEDLNYCSIMYMWILPTSTRFDIYTYIYM